jgi:DNA-binding transcriptional regulator YbjK
MHIVLGTENIQKIQDNYTVLELDTVRFSLDADPVTAYCIVEKMSVEEMFTVDRYRELHQNLMRNYRLANWKFCKDALEHLQGRWSGELDSFYQSLAQRIEQYQTKQVDQAWDGVVDRR